MKPRLLFLSVICVLLFGWYQMRIIPYGPTAERYRSDPGPRQQVLVPKDSSYHATAQTMPGVW